MAEFLGVALETIKCCGEPLLGLICNFKNLRKNFAQLEKDAKDLYVRRDDTKDVIRRGGEGKKTTGACQSWLEKVDEFEKEMEDTKNKYEANERCLWGWCPSIPWRIKLGEKVVEMMADVTGLMQELAEFADRVLVDIVPAVMDMPATSIEAATSTDLTIQNIMECIKDKEIGKIGVWGMGGVGKTTIMKNLNNRKDIADMFDIVIWVTVSKGGSVRKVQNEVAERLSLQMRYDASEDANAQKIFQNLKSRTFLLLLDDVWQKIDLDSIGIPNPDQQKGSKVILTTRSLNVCNQMETNKEIQVNVLSKDESWRLFREKAGEVVDSPNIALIAREVVEECGGLPLAIIVIGASLRKVTDVLVWNNALTELRSPDTSKREDMGEKVFRQLEYSYDRLRDENVQNCFLYGALYPEDYEIDIFELIEHWREEGFIDVVGSLARAREKGHEILKQLKDASLFESGEIVETVKMHDVIRDLALGIASPWTAGRKFLVRAGLQIEEAPKEEEWKHIERISLMSNNDELFNLPDRPECPTLTTLFLQLNLGLETIPKSFFNHMRVLRVLDLSDTCIECLPPSICNLANLVALYLYNCCRLVGLPSEIGKLKKLEVLSLDSPTGSLDTAIKCLPDEIRELSHLKSLKVALSSEVRNNEGQTIIISCGVLSSLSRLEELSIWFTPRPVDLMWEACVNIVEELCTLKQLNKLRFAFPTIECLEGFTNNSSVWNNKLLVAFSFTVGYYTRSQRGPLEDMGNPCLKFIGGNSIPDAVKEVLNRSKQFTLAHHSAVGNLSKFGVKNMSGLQHCMVSSCNAMETLIDGESILGEEGALPKLEILRLECLPSLRSIWEGPVPLGSLGYLKELTLVDCDGVSTILSRDMIKQLSNLEFLRVCDCSRIKEIVEEVTSVEVVHHLHLLPKLNTLYLLNLKKLERICCKGVQLALPSVESIRVEDCAKLTSVFEGILNLTSLRGLTLTNLPKISKIFSRETIQQLSNLEYLIVSDCPEIEEIFEEEETGEYHSLPKLGRLHLSRLQKLVSIGCKREREVPFCYPSLEIIDVEECPNLKRLSPGVENTATLKKIDGEREWWEALEWKNNAIKNQLQPLYAAVLRQGVQVWRPRGWRSPRGGRRMVTLQPISSTPRQGIW